MRNILFFGLILTFLACTGGKGKEQLNQTHHIIPIPQKVEIGTYRLDLEQGLSLRFPTENEAIQALKTLYTSSLSGLGLQVDATETGKEIPLELSLDATMAAEEGYTLSINGKGIFIKSKNEKGAFYALQSLLQLVENGTVPYVEIEDAPRFAYRGMHLDVSRHFFSVDFIKKYIDLLASYKMNRFHWHLTDDQGWRIEIKKYPKLQEIAAYRTETLIGHYNDSPQQYDGKRYGGFYSQEEVREVVAYAKARCVEVVPEIEMPGHAQAAISAYLELGCTGNKIGAATKWGVFEDVFCPNEATFEFLENVLTEVMELFPSEYIHVGGDECPKAQWEKSVFCQNLMKKEGLKDEHALQSYFIQRMGRFLEKNGRRLIGWDEILEGGLAENATVMSWRGEEGGIEAAKAGHDVVMTPTSHCYFDYYQSDAPNEPLAIGGLLTLEKVYRYEPVPEELSVEEAKHVLGTQGNVWTEYLPESKNVEYMILPRMPALAEVAWSQVEHKNLEDFTQRLQYHIKRWKKEGLNYADKTSDVRLTIIAGKGEPVRVRASTMQADQEIKIEMKSKAYNTAEDGKDILLLASSDIEFTAYEAGKPVGQPALLKYKHHKAAGAKVNLKTAPAKKYSGNGAASVLNGVLGSDERYGDMEWLGFDGADFDADIQLMEKQTISSTQFRLFNGPGQWIYLPKKIEIFDRDKKIAETSDIAGEKKVIEVKLDFEEIEVERLRIVISNFGEIPAGAQGAGNKAWLFVDEIIID